MNKIFQCVLVRGVAVFYILFGAFLTSFTITVLDFAQGHIIGDWSGIAPVGRFNDLPYRVAFAAGVALLINFLAFVFRYPLITKRTKLIAFGALCGLVTIGSLLGPWISETNSFFLICSLGVLCISFCYRLTLARSR